VLWHLHSPAGSPGQPPGGEVAAIAPEAGWFRKGIHGSTAANRQFVVLLQQPDPCLPNRPLCRSV